MKIVIIEDEKAAAENLKYLLSEIDPNMRVDTVLDTVSSAVDYFSQKPDIALAFFDIHLADGNSFEIFNQVEINIPIIFTTAYDEYAIKAFKVNSIHYLLKPIDEEELIEAVEKFKSNRQILPITEEFKQIISNISKESKSYKTAFLIQKQDRLIPIDVQDIAYFTIELGQVWAHTFHKKSYAIDGKLEEVEAVLDPRLFFRANRQYIVQRKAIESLTVYINGKLILDLHPKPEERVVVSKSKAPQLKSWMS